jgi:DNA-binding CsgD family transcriptional regulator
MVGRDAELEILRDALRHGRDGRPRVVVVRGEAGIGKTRLLQEFLAEASAASLTPPLVLAAGQCVDMGPIGAPFTAVRRLLRELYLGVGDERFRAAAQTAAVVATLATLVPDLAGADTASPPGAPYIAEAIERVLEALSVDHHLVLVIEDLHWADSATLALLKSLAVTLHGVHLTILMTYRSDDVGRHHPLRPMLAELDRNRSVVGLKVGRLGAPQVAQLVEQLGAGLSDESLSAVVARSEGVPFFVEELVDADEIDLPDTLREVVLTRFARLGRNAQEVVGVVAAGGTHVSEDLLDDVYPGDPVDLHEGLREAVAANVLVAGDDYAFRHALIQEAVHHELLPSERTGLHRRYAAALQARVDAGDGMLAAPAAEHWLAARDQPSAFDATVIALAHAEATYAPSVAAQLGERLLDLWPQVLGAEDRAGTTRTRLTVAVAAHWRDAADMVRSVRVARAELAASPDDPYDRAALHRAVAVGLGNAGDVVEALSEVEKAAALLEGADDPESLSLLSRTFSVMSALGDSVVGGPERRATLAKRAVELGEASGDATALCNALLVLAASEYYRGDLAASLVHLQRGIETAVDPGDRIYASTFLTGMLLRAGRFADAISESERARQQAVETGLESLVDVTQFELTIGQALLALGDAETGRARLLRVANLIPGTPSFRAACALILAISDVWDDQLDDAAYRHASEAATISLMLTDPDGRASDAVYDVGAALTALESETDPAVRLSLVDDAVRAGLVLTDEYVLRAPGISRILLPEAARAASAGRQLGHADADLLHGAVEMALAILPDDPQVEAIRAVSRAELTRGRGAGEPDAWRAAVSAAEEGYLHVRYVHYARYRLAESLVADGDRDEASDLLARVIAEAPAHGIAVVARWARELAARARLAVGGATATAVSHERAHAASGVSSLTPRELQVLALVAEGLTNPQIGRRLFISPKTASVHVSAILGKIGAANRAEAASRYTADASARSAAD